MNRIEEGYRKPTLLVCLCVSYTFDKIAADIRMTYTSYSGEVPDETVKSPNSSHIKIHSTKMMNHCCGFFLVVFLVTV